MNREDLRYKVLYDVPEIEDSWPDVTLTDNNINDELSRAALEITYLTSCLPKDNSSNPIDIVNDQANYELPSDLLVIDEEAGIFFLDSGSDWQKLKIVDMSWLDENKADWRNEDASSGGPGYCYQRGNNLYIYPKLNADRSNALLVYYGTAPDEMDDDADEPFNNISYLDPFHLLVALRVKIEAKRAKGKFGDVATLQNEYVARLQEMNNFVHGRRLRYHSPDFIQRIRGYWSHFRR